MQQAAIKKGRNWMLLISAGILGLLALTAALAPWISPQDPLAVNLNHLKQPPGTIHWFGTDTVGRDVFSRVIYGSRISLAIGISATGLSLCIGLLAGLIAGYRGGIIDSMITMVTDLFLAFPSLLLAIGISVLMPPGLLSVTIALCLVGWASFARLFRGLVIGVKENVFVDAALAVGCSHRRILFVHILPHCLPVALVAASLKVGSFILAESALSFLGLGVQAPTPTWGAMISLSRNYLPTAPWMVFFPGAAIALTVMACNIFGDTLRDRLDPNLKF